MNRRNFLQALAALPLLGAIPAAASGPQSFTIYVKRDYVDAGEWSMVLDFKSFDPWDNVTHVYSPASQPGEYPKLGEYSLDWWESHE